METTSSIQKISIGSDQYLSVLKFTLFSLIFVLFESLISQKCVKIYKIIIREKKTQNNNKSETKDPNK